jgi:RNA polymerase sigma factor (sigma-70 family)
MVMAAIGPSNQVDDAALIEQSWDTAELFGQVFDRYATVIHRYLARRAGTDLADDLTGQTFLVAFDRRRTYDLTQAVALPWLYGIATNLLGRHRRTEARQYRAFARTGVDPVIENHADAVASRVAAGSALAGVLGRLPAVERDILLLIAWEGLAYHEVAAALDIPIGTVRSRLHRAKTKVRTALATTERETDDDRIA